MGKIDGESFFGQIIKGVITALCVTLVAALCFALVLSLTNLSDGIIKPVNCFIRLGAIFCGACTAIKNDKGLIKGLIIGLSATILSFLIFSIIGGGLNFGREFFIDLLCGAVVGGLSGMIAVFLPRRTA